LNGRHKVRNEGGEIRSVFGEIRFTDYFLFNIFKGCFYTYFYLGENCLLYQHIEKGVIGMYILQNISVRTVRTKVHNFEKKK